jgi:hypothetical protein
MKIFILVVVVLSLLASCTSAWELTLYNKANHKGLKKHHVGSYPSHRECHAVTYGSKSAKVDQVGSLKFKMTGNEPYSECLVTLYSDSKCNGTGKALASEQFRKDNKDTSAWYRPTYYKIECIRPKYNCIYHSGCGKFSAKTCRKWCRKAGLTFTQRNSSGCDRYLDGLTLYRKVKCCCN